MKQHLKVPMELRGKIDECVAMAQAATNNKLRAHHYATAQAYLQLYEAEASHLESKFATLKRNHELPKKSACGECRYERTADGAVRAQDIMQRTLDSRD